MCSNQETLERMYSAFLVENVTNYEDSAFNQFLIEDFDELCPAGGVINYEDRKVKCIVHQVESERYQDEEPGEELTWL